ncbi:uncharacterized protein N7477_001938 [Penicillium maclennaniae]|uniref:uncharacterized protein n=1 Tax=Penicillium maclennaniae TaxID=1343394 RepID=UPI00253FE3F9|nr:uncharacterized protein N7477_001938 [Penicillium maclennaniae]KAJ5681998.1 hypothetical protein N7477_001938 [Penicillium maclennaniae]
MALLNGSFATFLIVCPTCFFLGIIFSLFPYDYPILWSTVPTPESHFDYLEAHLRFLHASPPLIPRILHIVIFLGLAGLISKLYRPSESNMLFDGASSSSTCAASPSTSQTLSRASVSPPPILGREDSLKVLAASNTILALVLVGVLVLQAGQWYAERKDAQEFEDLASGKKEDAEPEAVASGSAKPGRQGSQRKKSN